MAMQIITLEDLHEFKSVLLKELTEIFKATSKEEKKWLKSREVRNQLGISNGTLQNLRINGTLTYTKIGGILYYDQTDIDKILRQNKVNATPTLFK